jgi:D-amino-acid oxidase
MSLTTLSINPLIYLPYLQGQLLTHGTKFIRRHLSHITQAKTLTNPPPTAIINATGLAALTLGGVEDKNMYPTRGQLILVTNECPRMYARSLSKFEQGKSWTYIIPRAFGGGTILGGCRQNGNWSGEVDYELAAEIAKKCVKLCPELTGGKGVEGLDISRHIVGLRPSREGGARLEVERCDYGLVVHNYGIDLVMLLIVGAGGTGYQSSWGMAVKAVELLENALASRVD